MVMVPTYTNKASVPGSTGMQNVPLSLATSPLSGAGAGLAQVASALDAAGQRIQRRENVIAQDKILDSFTQTSREEFNNFVNTEDLSDTSKVLPAYSAIIENQILTAVGKFEGDENGRVQLESRLRASGRQNFGNMTSLSNTAQYEYIGQKIGEYLDPIYNEIDNNPDDLRAIIDKGLDVVSRYSNELPDSREIEWQTTVENQITLRAFNKYLLSNDWESAVDLRKNNPDIMNLLDEDTREEISDKIVSLQKSENEALKKGQGIRDMLTGAYGRPPTEREIAEKLGTTYLGQSFSTEMGKFMFNSANDRRNILKLADGDESDPAVVAFDEWHAEKQNEIMGGPPASFSDTSNLRKEYISGSANYMTVRSMYETVKELSVDVSGSNDVGMIYSIMKMFDPNSAIKQDEYATAQNTGGVQQKFIASYNSALDGTTLTPEMRKNFVATAMNVMRARNKAQTIQNGTYSNLAERAGILPGDVVVYKTVELSELEKKPTGTFDRANLPPPAEGDLNVNDGYRSFYEKRKRGSDGPDPTEVPKLVMGADGKLR